MTQSNDKPKIIALILILIVFLVVIVLALLTPTLRSLTNCSKTESLALQQMNQTDNSQKLNLQQVCQITKQIETDFAVCNKDVEAKSVFPVSIIWNVNKLLIKDFATPEDSVKIHNDYCKLYPETQI